MLHQTDIEFETCLICKGIIPKSHPDAEKRICRLCQSKREECIAKIQPLIDKMREMPPYKKYVDEHKLKLLNSKLEVYDRLLDEGWLK